MQFYTVNTVIDTQWVLGSNMVSRCALYCSCYYKMYFRMAGTLLANRKTRCRQNPILHVPKGNAGMYFLNMQKQCWFQSSGRPHS